MAGLSNRSRPVLGVGEYLLPLEFTLLPDVNVKPKSIVAPVAKKPFNLRTKLSSGNNEFVVPIIKSDFKLRPKVSYRPRTALSPVQRKPFLLLPKVLSVTKENLVPVMRSSFTLGTKVTVADSTVSAAQPRTANDYAGEIFPRNTIKGINFEGNIGIIGDAENVVFEGGSSVKSIINDIGKSSITYNLNRQLELEFYTTEPITIRGFSFRSQLDSPLSSYAPLSIGIYDIKDGANRTVMSISSLSTNEPITDYFKSLGKLSHFKVVFFGRNTKTSLQYFKLF